MQTRMRRSGDQPANRSRGPLPTPQPVPQATAAGQGGIAIWSRGDVAALQRLAGNAATTRAVRGTATAGGHHPLGRKPGLGHTAPVAPLAAERAGAGARRAGAAAPGATVLAVQRLAVDEHPVRLPKPLERVRPLLGGQKGKLFLLETEDQRLVVKFQRESPTGPRVGTAITKKAGVETPDLRLATSTDLDVIEGGLRALAGRKVERAEEALAGFAEYRTWPHALLMDFASGVTIMSMMNEEPSKLLAALRSPGFQESLGRLLAADAFAGNADRAMAVKDDGATNRRGTPVYKGWYHEQNLMIKEVEGGFRAVAIDNAFVPELGHGVAPYGRYMGNIGVQFASTGAANPALFATEVGLILDRILRELVTRHPGAADDVRDFQQERDRVIAGVVRGGTAAMQTLLARGQRWKQTVAQHGATEEEGKHLQDRKRYLRLLESGLDPAAGRKLLEQLQHWQETDAPQFVRSLDQLELASPSALGTIPPLPGPLSAPAKVVRALLPRSRAERRAAALKANLRSGTVDLDAADLTAIAGGGRREAHARFLYQLAKVHRAFEARLGCLESVTEIVDAEAAAVRALPTAEAKRLRAKTLERLVERKESLELAHGDWSRLGIRWTLALRQSETGRPDRELLDADLNSEDIRFEALVDLVRDLPRASGN